MNKIVYNVIKLNCKPQRAFDMFTINKHLQQWLTLRADVEPRVSGKYELYWNSEDKENDSTIGCKITAIEQGKFLSFEWKGPKQYKHIMNEADPLTHVVVFFISCKDDDSDTGVEVHLIHLGWRISAEWEEARLWFEKAWNNAFERLEKYVNEL
jgi:uncharacterized protein YndB with AHSA1/START domain